MPIQLTAAALRQVFPKAPQDILDAFLAKQSVFDKVGLNHTRLRLSVALSQVEHETGGFTIKNLTESIAYTHDRAARIWPSRFPGGGNQVRTKYGDAPGWQRKLIDDVYGNRMGNRPGTHDGSTFIGHGGPQWTGRDGHEALARILKELVPEVGSLTAEEAVSYAISHDFQPEVLAAFWKWKNLNPVVDAGGLKAATKPWNGGYIGMADREAKMAGNDPIIARLAKVERIAPVAKSLPGAPPTPAPPKDVLDAATEGERKVIKGGVAGEVVGTATKTVTEQPTKPIVQYVAEWTLIGACAAILIVGLVLLAKKRAAVVANWF